jgi:AAA+ superfamily predicted ATPase
VPPLVIVCGPPAAGKTILSTTLGNQLGMPVLSKDLVKEAMMDHLGGAPAVRAVRRRYKAACPTVPSIGRRPNDPGTVLHRQVIDLHRPVPASAS